MRFLFTVVSRIYTLCVACSKSFQTSEMALKIRLFCHQRIFRSSFHSSSWIIGITVSAQFCTVFPPQFCTVLHFGMTREREHLHSPAVVLSPHLASCLHSYCGTVPVMQTFKLSNTNLRYMYQAQIPNIKTLLLEI